MADGTAIANRKARSPVGAFRLAPGNGYG